MLPMETYGPKTIGNNEYLRRLEEACTWLGITKGRAQHYVRLLRQYHDEGKSTRQHVLAYSESLEILDIFRTWQIKIDQFPGLQLKISEALQSGPVVREQERASRSNNRPRNDAFVYFLAGMLLAANVRVVAVDGILKKGVTGSENADITFLEGHDLIDIQCKRPQRFRGIDQCVKKARKQIEIANRIGVIAIDCSAFIRPPHSVLGSTSLAEANSFVGNSIQKVCRVTLMQQRKPNVLGFILFARVPLMTKTGGSQIVSQSGAGLFSPGRESLSTYVYFNNRHSQKPDLLWRVVEQLKSVVASH